ncbi:hypothetical protein KCP69_23325 [Salmonella enterica subsp. enterica]|nr:hypothetical protein KCP69_23325 [Salmonella enterica subsp. enterica]
MVAPKTALDVPANTLANAGSIDKLVINDSELATIYTAILENILVRVILLLSFDGNIQG